MNNSKRRNGRILGLLVFFILCFFASFFLGRYPITPKELIEVVASRILPIEKTWTSAVEHVIFQVRLPRVLLAALIGAGLSCAGAAYQGIFQNPMVSPSVLGASAGAAFGAALGLFFSMNYGEITVLAFLFGIGAVLLVCLIGSRVRQNQTLGLVLAGMMVGSLFSSAVSFLKLVADTNNTLPGDYILADGKPVWNKDERSGLCSAFADCWDGGGLFDALED